MKKVNFLKKIALFGVGALTYLGTEAQVLHGSVRLASDSVTPVANAQVKLWHEFTVGNPGDTTYLVTDSLGNYHIDPFKINEDPDTAVSTSKEKPSLEQLVITNNPGREHKFIIPHNAEPTKYASIYNLQGKEISKIRNHEENGNIVSSWNGATKQGNAKEGLYIYFQQLKNGKTLTAKFIQMPNAMTTGNSGEVYNKNNNGEKSFPTKSMMNLDQATYIFELRSLPGTTNPEFISPQIDTIVFTPVSGVSDFYAHHFVREIPQNRDVSIIIREPYDTLRLENVMVKIKDAVSGTIIDSSLTDTNGIAVMQDVPLGTVFTWEYGNDTTINNRADYFSRIETGLDSITGVNHSLADTIETTIRNRILPPKQGKLPSLTFNYQGSVALQANWLSELVDKVDIEVAKGRGTRISLPNLSGPYSPIYDYLIEADSLLNGADTNALHIVAEATAPTVTTSMIASYNEDSNYYPDTIGVRIVMGTENVQKDSIQISSGEYAIVNGTYTTSSTLASPLWETIFGIYAGLPTSLPSGRVSFINSPTNITTEDQALYKLIMLNGKARFLYHLDKENYSDVHENL